jgi:hypothetical protein
MRKPTQRNDKISDEDFQRVVRGLLQVKPKPQKKKAKKRSPSKRKSTS